MTEEKIKQGEELIKKLNHLKDQRKRWEIAVRFFRVEVSDAMAYDRNQKVLSVEDTFINFNELKLLVLAKIDRRIEEVQKQFDNL